MQSFDEWRQRWLEAYIWWCGDEQCDCSQPVVDQVTPTADYPLVRRKRIWEGTFCSSLGCGLEASESELQERELQEAATRYGITLEDHHGRRPVASTEGGYGNPKTAGDE